MPPKTIKITHLVPTIFYGWIVVAVGFLTLAVAFGLWYSFSVFFIAIIEDFGWSRAAVSSIFSIFLLCHALAAPLAGHLQDRFGPRVTIPLGCILLTVALVMTSRAQLWWHFIVCYGFMSGVGVSLLVYLDLLPTRLSFLAGLNASEDWL